MRKFAQALAWLTLIKEKKELLTLNRTINKMTVAYKSIKIEKVSKKPK